MDADDQEDFVSRYVVNEVSKCWIWVGARIISKPSKRTAGWPYGQFRGRAAHRVSYEMHVGPIPEGLCLDHLCRNTLCVNPAHLEPVTHQVNIRRGYALKPLVTHCKHGHEYTEENTYWKKRPGGTTTRECRTCRKDQIQRVYAKRG